MSAINSTTSSSAVAATAANKNSLSTLDFTKLMITELTNQDPFEPMTNQELIQQMATLQQLQSNQTTQESFSQMFNQLDTFLNRQKLSDATSMIGEMVMGTTASGVSTYGQVIAVNVDGNQVNLELDNGWSVNIEKVSRMGGTNSQNLVGSVVLGTNAAGKHVVGAVKALEMSSSGTILVLDNAAEDRVAMTTAVPLNAENITGLIGASVKGKVNGSEIQGTITSAQLNQAGEITLKLLDGQEMALSDLTEIISIGS